MSEKIIAMIPARIGSTRLAKKNLALIDGQPLISYSIEAAKKSSCFDEIIINSDSDIFSEVAKRYGVQYYKRPEEIGSSITRSDEVVFDFLEKNDCDIIVWVNPISPLQTGSEIRGALEYFRNNNLDSMFTVKNEQVHHNYNRDPLNYNTSGSFELTQNLIPVQRFVYSIMAWNAKLFKKNFIEKGFSFFLGNVGYYNVSLESSLIVKTIEDLKLIEQIVVGRKSVNKETLLYDELISENDNE